MSNKLKNVNVDSSMIKTIGFLVNQNPDGTITHKLRVLFNNDSVYDYADVPLATYNRLLTSPSTGKAFNVLIRDQFDAVQLTG